jgi:hypothetical protein
MSPTESIPMMRRYDMGTLWSSRLEISVGSCVARVKRKRGEAKVLPNAGGTAGNGWKFLVPGFWILCGRAQLRIPGLFLYAEMRICVNIYEKLLLTQRAPCTSSRKKDFLLLGDMEMSGTENCISVLI